MTLRALIHRWLALAALAVAPCEAFAQEARPAVEEIVVTARKTEENIQDVPIAVTALSAESPEQSSTFEMKDLGLRVPNLTTRYGPVPRRASLDHLWTAASSAR